MDNVNNLNGIPNFGHGFSNQEATTVEPTDTQEEATPTEEEVEITNPTE